MSRLFAPIDGSSDQAHLFILRSSGATLFYNLQSNELYRRVRLRSYWSAVTSLGIFFFPVLFIKQPVVFLLLFPVTLVLSFATTLITHRWQKAFLESSGVTPFRTQRRSIPAIIVAVMGLFLVAGTFEKFAGKSIAISAAVIVGGVLVVYFLVRKNDNVAR